MPGAQTTGRDAGEGIPTAVGSRDLAGGRDPAASAIQPWVDVVIAGAPGMGKSTLAQIFAASQQVVAHFPMGCCMPAQQTADVHVWLARWANSTTWTCRGRQDGAVADVLRDQLKGLAILVIWMMCVTSRL